MHYLPFISLPETSLAILPQPVRLHRPFILHSSILMRMSESHASSYVPECKFVVCGGVVPLQIERQASNHGSCDTGQIVKFKLAQT